MTRDLVLVGGGHTHALVLRKWGMRPLPGVRLTLINPGPTAPYSGMLPGFVAGHYDRAALDIDLVQLAQFAGARLILGAAEHIDLHRRAVHVAGRPPIAFDACALDIGITSDMPTLPGFQDFAVPAKPLGRFASAWEGYLAGQGPADVAVIGGGVAGAELALAMAHALRARGRPAQVTLIEAAKALSALRHASRVRVLAALQAQGVTLLENAPVAAVTRDHVTLVDGRAIAASFVTGAAGARPYGWLRASGLVLEDGFVSVNSRLIASDPTVFAVGDCAHLAHDPRPKAGVYAVRQAPVLFNNLRAMLSGGAQRRYRAQKDYLKLVSLGGKQALGERFGFAFGGAAVWRLKDRIDQSFMQQFRDLPVMAQPELPVIHAAGMRAAMGDKPLCGGCGAKVGRIGLRDALVDMTPPARADIVPVPGDDAAILLTGGAQQVLSADHLSAVISDPVVMARIAAVHALGDIWAMGAAPQAATASVILPRLSERLQQRSLSEIMTTAQQVMAEAGADIVGGHSTLGDTLTIGFAITGLCERPPVTLAGGQPGDVLILTKPLGSGVIMAALMAGVAPGAVVAGALDQMVQPQGQAAQILAPLAHAMTDVTGFGLAGHLANICEASGCSATLDMAGVPMMAGAVALADAGQRSSLFAQNRALAPEVPTGGAADLLFDPQTAGGLLAAIPADQVEATLGALAAHGYRAASIGRLTDGSGQVVLT